MDNKHSAAAEHVTPGGPDDASSSSALTNLQVAVKAAAEASAIAAVQDLKAIHRKAWTKANEDTNKADAAGDKAGLDAANHAAVAASRNLKILEHAEINSDTRGLNQALVMATVSATDVAAAVAAQAKAASAPPASSTTTKANDTESDEDDTGKKTQKKKVDKNKQRLGMSQSRKRRGSSKKSKGARKGTDASSSSAKSSSPVILSDSDSDLDVAASAAAGRKIYRVPFNVSPSQIVPSKETTLSDKKRKRQDDKETPSAAEAAVDVAASAVATAEVAVTAAEKAVTVSAPPHPRKKKTKDQKESSSASKTKVHVRPIATAEAVHLNSSAPAGRRVASITRRHDNRMAEPSITFDLHADDVPATEEMRKVFENVQAIATDLLALAHTGQHAIGWGSANRLGRHPNEMATTSVGIITDLMHELENDRNALRKIRFPSSGTRPARTVATERQKQKTTAPPPPAAVSSSNATAAAAVAGAPVATPLLAPRDGIDALADAATTDELIEKWGDSIMNPTS